MSGFVLQVGRSPSDMPPTSFGAATATTTQTATEFSQIQIAAGARGLWLVDFDLLAADVLSVGVFATDQLDGAVDTAVAVQAFDLAVQATVKHGTSLSAAHAVTNFTLWTGSISNPVYCPPSKFLLIGDRSANTTWTASLRFIEYH